MNIDFTPITNTSVYEQDKLKLATSGNKRAWQIWTTILFIFIPIFWPYLLFTGLRWYKKHKVQYKQRNEALELFTKTNDFTFTDISSGKWVKNHSAENKTYNLPFNTYDLYNAHIISGKMLGYDFEYTMSSVMTKLSGGQISQFPYNLFTITLPVQLPKIFIDSKINNLEGLDANAVNFNAYEDHQLEGDFYTYYNVRIEKNEQIDMYTILTPEVMDTLKRNNYFDIWLSGNQLTLLTFGDQARYFAATPQVFENALTLMQEIDKIARAIR